MESAGNNVIKPFVPNVRLIYSVTIPNYIRKVKLSDARRAKYYTFPKDESVKTTKKKFNSNRYQWREYTSSTKKKEIRLFDTATNEFVVKNTRTAGTERWEVINAEKVYNRAYHPSVQAKIVREIGQFLLSFLKAMPVISQFPLYVQCEIHDYNNDKISGNIWDVINRGYLYCKVFEDILKPKTDKNPLGLGVIPDDSYKYIMCPAHPIFYSLGEKRKVFTEEMDSFLDPEPKLVFNIYVCQ